MLAQKFPFVHLIQNLRLNNKSEKNITLLENEKKKTLKQKIK